MNIGCGRDYPVQIDVPINHHCSQEEIKTREGVTY